MRSTLCPVFLIWALLHLLSPIHAQDTPEEAAFEEVAPLVLPELKPLPGLSFRGPFSEDAKVKGFEVTGQA